MNLADHPPTISILVPTYRRKALLERNLRCCAVALQGVEPQFEVLVGDNGGDPEIASLLTSWSAETGISARYYGEVLPTMEANHQRLLAAARGAWVQVVHDDDYLLPGSGALLLASVAETKDTLRPIRHAVMLVDHSGKQLRVEGMNPSRTFHPRDAVHRLISESSFVRMPAMLLPREPLIAAGGFDRGMGPLFDWATWLALVETRGLITQPRMTAAYTQHPQAGTDQMFTPKIVSQLEVLLLEHGKRVGFNSQELKRALGRFLWRFGLAGCIRAVKRKDYRCLESRLQMLVEPPFARWPCPWRWLPLFWFLRSWVGLSKAVL